MKRAGFLFTVLLFGAINIGFAQSTPLCGSDNVSQPGKVKVSADPRLNDIIFPEVTPEDKGPELQGYRVQVYSGNDRGEANKVKYQMLQMYPNQPAYLDYQAPYFRVRVGDFRNKLEAQKILHELKGFVNGAVLLVPEKINFPELRH